MRLVIISAALFAASGSASAEDITLSKACPILSPAQVKAIETHKGRFTENGWYARSNCVSIEEAERRMAIQLRDSIGPKTEPGPPPAPPPDSIGAVAAALNEKERDTFGSADADFRCFNSRVVAGAAEPTARAHVDTA